MAPIPSLDTELSQPEPSPFLYPVALNVRDRRCVVVGGGSVGVRKAMALLAAGAEVTVIAPAASPALGALAEDERVTYLAEPFIAAHLEEAFLVIAATDRGEVNQAVADAARARGVLLNLAAEAGEAEAGDFAAMAAVRRGDLVLGVTTGGAGPALTARIKQDMEAQYGAYWDRYVSLLGTMRTVAKRDIPDTEERAKALRLLAASDTVRNAVAMGDTDAYMEALRCLFP
ncbi:MAG: bifunctional precorrin-2 dehydrogenase/sirohydrochlorin ferrochelatase [Armatimonadota bacterium]